MHLDYSRPPDASRCSRDRISGDGVSRAHAENEFPASLNGLIIVLLHVTAESISCDCVISTQGAGLVATRIIP